jgi:1-deoxy-D-xylulose-5-phosphate synthase
MAYEAMNNAGALDSRHAGCAQRQRHVDCAGRGALTNYLSWLVSTHPFLSIRDIALKLSNKFPKTLRKAAERVDEYARGMVMGGTLFEELGFYYVGPVDGHDLETLVPVLQNIREAKEVGPVLFT